MPDREIYCDNAATTRPHEAVVEAMLPFFRDRFGNASSMHRKGSDAARALDDARIAVARALGRETREIVFTSGGTEANNLALRGAALADRRRGDHIVASAVEHPSVLETLRGLEKEGFRVSLVPVARDGSLDAKAVLDRIETGTGLLSIMHVQNETGVVFDVESIARAAKARRPGLVVHSDGVQALGKLRAPAASLVDLYTVSAHKVHGPKGAGAVAVSRGVRLVSILQGGGQESGLRSGTENLPALVGFGAAARIASAGLDERVVCASPARASFVAGLVALGGVVNGPDERSPARTVPSIVNASFEGVAAEPLLHALEERGVFVSSGSACNSRKKGRSHVLEAMALPEERLASALRFSFDLANMALEVPPVLAALESALVFLRAAPSARERGRGARAADRARSSAET